MTDGSRETARVHFRQLRAWLDQDGQLSSQGQRSHARDKLTRLTRQQFMELSTDVYDELMRRSNSSPSEQPFLPLKNEFHPKRNQARQKLATLPLQRYRDLASDVYFELERRYPEFLEEDEPRSAPFPPASSSTSAPSTARDMSPTYANQQQQSRHIAASQTPNDVVVPNKSTLVVENNGSQANSGSASNHSSTGLPYDDRGMAGRPSLDKDHNNREYEREDLADASPTSQGRGVARASETSSLGTRFFGGYTGSAQQSEAGARKSWDFEEREKLKSDYEYKIAMLTDKVRELERENEDAREHLKSRSSADQKVRELEGQVRQHRDHADDLSNTLASLRVEHDTLQKSTRAQASSSNDINRLTNELHEAKELANELRGEVTSLAEELRNVSARYEASLGDLDIERKQRADLEDEIRSWRKRYEGAKTELRSVKATSQMFSSDIRIDRDHMPASPDGLIADVSLTAFQSSIDDLLQAARSQEPSTVIEAARSVVSAVGKIDSDVTGAEQAILSMSASDQDRVHTLKSNTHATLSNLVTAARNHATSFGYSPVSLVDAAASHVSASVIELVKTLKIRRTNAFNRDTAGTSGSQPLPPAPGSSKSPSVRSFGASQPQQPSSGSYHRANGSGSSSGMPSASASRYERTMSPIPDRASAQSAYSNHARQASTAYNSSAGGHHARNASTSYSHASRPSDDRTQQQQSRQYDGGYAAEQQQQPASAYDRYDSIGRQGMSDRQQLQDQYANGQAYGQQQQADSSYEDEQRQYNNHDNRNMPYDEPRYDDDLAFDDQQQPHDMGHGEYSPRQDSEQLRAYLESQTEAIVHSIQSLLSAIRSGAQSAQLNENLTSIITIVSSIVAISKDAIAQDADAETRREGESILADLATNCDRLSEMQQQQGASAGGPAASFNKVTKQNMATASFGVAKSLKALNALLEQSAQQQQQQQGQHHQYDERGDHDRQDSLM